MNRTLDRRRNPSSLFGVDPFLMHRDLFGSLFNNGFSIGGLNDVFQSDFGVKVIDVENGKQYHFGLPGVEKENISIDVSDNILEVSVVQEDDSQSRTYSSKVVLSPDVDLSKGSAEYRNGLLVITIPHAEKRTMKIPVLGGDENQGAIGVNENTQGEVTQGESINDEQKGEKST